MKITLAILLGINLTVWLVVTVMYQQVP